MTNANHTPMELTHWTCSECGKHQIEAVTEFHLPDEQLICSECLCMTGANQLDTLENRAYLIAMRDAREAMVA